MFQKALKNSIFTIVGQILILLLGLVFAGMTIKYIGPAKAGFFILISTILGWVNLAGGGAFHAPAVKHIAETFEIEKKRDLLPVLRTVVSANLITGLPFAILTCILFPIFFSWSKLSIVDKQSAFMVVLLSSISFLFDQYSGAIRAAYEGLQRFDILAIVKVIIGLVSGVLRLLTLVYFRDMTILAIANLLIAFITLVLDLFLVRYLIGYFVLPGWVKGVLTPFMSFGIWSWLGNTSNIIFFNLTTVVLTRNVGTATLMFVSLPQSIVLAVGQFIISVAYIIFPLLANQKEFTLEVIKRIEDRFRWFLSVISFFIYSCLSLLGPILFTILVDKNYSNHASLIFTIFCIYGIIWSQEVFHVFAIMSVGKVKINTITNLVTSVFTLVVTLIFIPFIGFIGHPLAQMFKFPGVIWHTIWSREKLHLSNQIKDILSPIISPFIAILFLNLSIYFIRYILHPNMFNEIVLIFFLALLSVHIVVQIEKKYFKRYNRLILIESILSPLTFKISPKVHFYINKYLN